MSTTETKEFLVSGGPSGGGAYPVTIAIGELLNKYVTVPYKLKAVVQPITAMVESPKRLARGEVEIAWTSASTAYPAALGTGAFKDMGKVPMRVLFWGDPYAYHIYTTNSKIQSVSDLKGKRVAGELMGSPPTNIIRQAVFEAHGFSDKDVKVMPFRNINECSQLLKEGMADAVMTTTSFHAASIDEIIASKPVYFISLSEETIERVVAKMGPMWTKVTIPANAYKGQTSAVPTIGGYAVFICRPDLDETLAYSIVKAIYDHQQEFWGYHAGAKSWTLENTIAMWAIPYHPGAIKYYKEKGIWKGNMDARQTRLLEIFKWRISNGGTKLVKTQPTSAIFDEVEIAAFGCLSFLLPCFGYSTLTD
jgi:TRAP transporter TAXI family solute receptor